MNHNNPSMANIFSLFNDLSQVNNDIYEQNIINNVIEQSLLDANPIKHVLSKEGEEQLTLVQYQQSKYSMKECPITLVEFKENDMVTKLPCNHIFDTSGILWWLKEEQASCPVCRTKLKHNEISVSNNNSESESDAHRYNFQTNPLTLFSNITIDLSLNSQLTQPYNRNYNLTPFESILESIDEDSNIEENDDLFFFNTLQMMQDPDNFMSNFQHIFTDISANTTNADNTPD